MSSQNPSTARAPGKLILSGEHAVVFGAPALSMAVDLTITARWKPTEGDTIEFQPAEAPAFSCGLRELQEFRHEAAERLELYRSGQLTATKILEQDTDLLKLAAAYADPTCGGSLTVDGSIPRGSGMGSSAALILSVLTVLRKSWHPDKRFRTALVVEHHQHGRSSGLDLYTSQQGGVVQIESGLFSTTDAHRPRFRLFQTGEPECSTGECVASVRDHFGEDELLWRDFASVTRDMRSALQRGDELQFRDSIRSNHRLLCHIGVVPDRVNNCVRAFEEIGCAAKLCGAGAVRGDRGGVLLVAGTGDFGPIVEQFGIEEIAVAMDHNGLMRL